MPMVVFQPVHTHTHILTQCMKEVHIHHLRLLLLLSQLSCIFLFPFWMYTDVWELITQLHKVSKQCYLL